MKLAHDSFLVIQKVHWLSLSKPDAIESGEWVCLATANVVVEVSWKDKKPSASKCRTKGKLQHIVSDISLQPWLPSEWGDDK